MRSVVERNVVMRRIPYCCVIFTECLSLTGVATGHITEFGRPLTGRN